MKTVKVRIAVAVNGKGEWSAGGGHNWDNADAEYCVLEALSTGGEIVHWVEAEIPVPETTTVQGAVVT